MTATKVDAGPTYALYVALIGVLLALPAGSASRATTVRAGHVVLVEQSAMQKTALVEEKLREGDSVFQQATINTNWAGRAKMQLDDGSSLTLGANSDLVIDDFVYQPERDSGRASLRLLQGIMRMLSGRMRPGSYSVSTRIAVLGIRGTSFTIDNRNPEILSIRVDQGTVLARPLQSGKSYRLAAPSYAVCTLTACTFGDVRRAWEAPIIPDQPAVASSDALIR
ncbi:MAG: FecR domain-containing protein [Pseudomonadota bacterium]